MVPRILSRLRTPRSSNPSMSPIWMVAPGSPAAANPSYSAMPPRPRAGFTPQPWTSAAAPRAYAALRQPSMQAHATPSAPFQQQLYSLAYSTVPSPYPPSPTASQWLLDSDVSHYISTDLANLSLHQPYTQQDTIHIGDGTALPVANTGPARLNVTSGLTIFFRFFVKVWMFCREFLLKDDMKWFEASRGHLVVASSLIATVAFQAGMKPAGGVWQDTTTQSSDTSKFHDAATAILASTATHWQGLRTSPS